MIFFFQEKRRKKESNIKFLHLSPLRKKEELRDSIS